ncbi:MAG: hypothetical protein NT155_00350 [Candidatus Staskawiczbacteria bacterium]|nr:hypothetical protein [Candidatus Staskawiczbacteria bacterium]
MKDIFQINSNKASSKVTINSFMMGSLFFILTLIWTLNPSKFSVFIIAQIVLAIPMLFVSSLAYAKIGHWEKVELWDILGWFTNNIGSIFILNAVGLMTAQIYKSIAVCYFALLILLMAVYSIINVVYRRSTLKEKIFKFAFFVFILALGGIVPLFF